MKTQEQSASLHMAHAMAAIAVALLGWTSIMGAAAMGGASRALLDTITVAVAATLALSGGLLAQRSRKRSAARETAFQPPALITGSVAVEGRTGQSAECARDEGASHARTEDPSEERLEPDCPRDGLENKRAYLEFSRDFGLSLRERDVLRLLAAGMTGKEIARELMLSYNTVKSHIRHIYDKTGVHRKQDLVDLIYQHETPDR